MVVSRRTYSGRAVGFARRQVLGIGQRLTDRVSPTYLASAPASECLRYLKPIPAELLAGHQVRISGLVSNYMAHRFDILGSGWATPTHGMRARGVEGYRYEAGAMISADADGRWLQGRINRPNLPRARRIWRMIEPGYIPIDWQRDLKSGYRWSEATWYLDIRYGHKPGVDIKVPWELARMEHLPQLALAFVLATRGVEGFSAPDTYLGEFRNQVLDFIATNPPRFGVNWRSAMEVAIRAANWLVAADLFRCNGASFAAEFEGVLVHSIFEHGLHIEANLEWDPEVRGNHYLANIVGMLFIAAYLPCTPKTDTWLAFAVRELIHEADFQFAPEGTHREASTGYHRLTAEMMAYATALVLGLPQHKRQALECYDHRRVSSRPTLPPAPVPLYGHERAERGTPFPGWYFERLERMGEFVAHITKPSGRVPQIGDNDSGRFLRVDGPRHQMPVGEAKGRYANLHDYDGLPEDADHWYEDHLDHRSVAAAIGALLERRDLVALAGEGSLEAEVIRALAGATHPISNRRRPEPASAAATVRIGSPDQVGALREEVCAQGSARCYEIPASAGADLREGLACYGYPEFGLYVFRSERLYLAVRCGRVGMVGNGGHAHHDQLAMELSVDGRDLIIDPGTYLYSALKERRNEYRGPAAHFAPQVDEHQAQGSGPGLFQMRDRAGAQCLYFGPQGFAGYHRGYQVPVYRVIEIGAAVIRITDGLRGAGRLCQLTPAFGYRCGWRESPRPSPGYGIVLRDAQ
jgi:hypothetical protein